MQVRVVGALRRKNNKEMCILGSMSLFESLIHCCFALLSALVCSILHKYKELESVGRKLASSRLCVPPLCIMYVVEVTISCASTDFSGLAPEAQRRRSALTHNAIRVPSSHAKILQ